MRNRRTVLLPSFTFMSLPTNNDSHPSEHFHFKAEATASDASVLDQQEVPVINGGFYLENAL